MPKSQLEGMPLPTAALVIDTRSGKGGNYITETLKSEVDNLCQDMQMEQVNQWRYLTSIIDYLSIHPLSKSEIQKYRNPYKPQPTDANGGMNAAPAPANNPERNAPTITGRIDMQPPPKNSFFGNSLQKGVVHAIPEGIFKEGIRYILALCDSLRTKRVNATTDLGKRGVLGRTRPEDSVVRIIFIADARSEESLATAATYAAYLRKETLFQNDYDRQLLLSTVIICLNHENRGEAPIMLINALSWDNNDSWVHIDSCILVENYSERGSHFNIESQEEHVEFLLYILLITDPVQLRIDIQAPNINSFFAKPNVQFRMLPVEKCFSIGLSAFTYSARWGRTLLNNGLAQHVIQELLEHNQSSAALDTEFKTNKWLDEQLTIIQEAVPEHVTDDMPELNAITRATNVARTADEVFPARSMSVRVGQRSLENLDRYADTLKESYVGQAPGQANLREAVGRELTVHDYVRRLPGDIGNPLLTVVGNAHQVLTDRRFFEGTRGAVPRAKYQLSKIAGVIAERYNKHRSMSINVVKLNEGIQQRYKDERKSLDALNEQFPLLGTNFLAPMRVLTLLLWVFVFLLVSVSVMAWLYHAAFLYSPSTINFLDSSLFGYSFLTIFTIITALVVLSVIGITAFICTQIFFGERGTPLRVEMAFLISLIIVTLYGIVINLSLYYFADDRVSHALVGWLVDLQHVSAVTGIIAFIVAAIEVFYFLKWHRDVTEMRTRIINELRNQHLKTVGEIKSYLANAFLLASMQRAGLIDESGKSTGNYYSTLENLQVLLDGVGKRCEETYQTTQRHLERVTENPTQGPATDKPYLREELLEINALNSRLATLQTTMHTDQTFIAFVELLLRLSGVETPTTILRSLEERTQTGRQQFQMDGYQVEAQLLLSTIAVLALELSLEQPPANQLDIETFEKRYSGLDQHYQDTSMRNLLELTKTKFANNVSRGKKLIEADVELATKAMNTWSQIQWRKDDKLQQLLIKEGVLAHMERENFAPETIRTKFIIRTAPVNRSLRIGQQTDEYLILFPSTKGTKLLRELDVARVDVDFPDEELLALLSLSHYVSLPYEVKEETPALPSLGSPDQFSSTPSATTTQMLPDDIEKENPVTSNVEPGKGA